ncbi:MAG: creatininase family protein [Leadbetterella sp.]|nr:creatininase family protein [Leadbetterella sp.]
MKTTYLKEFIDYSAKKIAFVPMGTLEWHGNHLPIETDFLVAQKICELLNKKAKAYILPPIYLGTDRERVFGGKKFIGMNSRFGKELQGSVYYLKPALLFSMVQGLVDNLAKQGFAKIYIVTGHAGGKQIEILEKIEEYNRNVFLLNPYGVLSLNIEHADEYETSLFWACYPEQEAISRKTKIKDDDDYIKFVGYDPRERASLKLGNKILKDMISGLKKKIK